MRDGCCDLQYELARTQNEYDAVARGEGPISSPVDEPQGPFSESHSEILVDGMPQRVAVLTYRDYHAFRFQRGVHVTVVGRYDRQGELRFEPIADLRPSRRHRP